MWTSRLVLRFLINVPLAAYGQSLSVFEDSLGIRGMSRSGSWLIGSRGNALSPIPFIWSVETGFLTSDLYRGEDPELEFPGFPSGVDNDGKVFAGDGESPHLTDSDQEAARWTDAEGWKTITGSDSIFAAMPADGSTFVGTFYHDLEATGRTPERGFAWTVRDGLTAILHVAQIGDLSLLFSFHGKG